MDVLFVIGRILLGGYFISSGLNHFKKTDMLAGYASSRGLKKSHTMTILSGVVIVLGGAGVLLGILVEWSIALLSVFLILVSFQIHHFWKDDEENQRMVEMINFTKNLALLGAILMLLAIPTPWPFSLL